MNKNSTPALLIQNLTHSYSEAGISAPILRSINATIEQETITALLGHSGSGKSTFLNLISGLMPIQSGAIDIFGQSIGALNDRERTLLRRKKIGIVYQSFNLIPTLNVAENLALPLALNFTSKKEMQRRVVDCLQVLGLCNRANTFPDRLSGGEQQRVAIGRAIIHKPPLLLADEPTGNLDAESGRRILEILVNAVRVSKNTLILVTHSAEVASLADATLSLEHGMLIDGNHTTAW